MLCSAWVNCYIIAKIIHPDNQVYYLPLTCAPSVSVNSCPFVAQERYEKIRANPWSNSVCNDFSRKGAKCRKGLRGSVCNTYVLNIGCRCFV